MSLTERSPGFLTPSSSLTLELRPEDSRLMDVDYSSTDSEEFYEALESQGEEEEEEEEREAVVIGRERRQASPVLSREEKGDEATARKKMKEESDEEEDVKRRRRSVEGSPSGDAEVDHGGNQVAVATLGAGSCRLDGTVGAGATKREGALRQCGDLLLLFTGEPLCVPVTQVSVSALHTYMSVFLSPRPVCECVHTTLTQVSERVCTCHTGE